MLMIKEIAFDFSQQNTLITCHIGEYVVIVFHKFIIVERHIAAFFLFLRF